MTDIKYLNKFDFFTCIFPDNLLFTTIKKTLKARLRVVAGVAYPHGKGNDCPV